MKCPKGHDLKGGSTCYRCRNDEIREERKPKKPVPVPRVPKPAKEPDPPVTLETFLRSLEENTKIKAVDRDCVIEIARCSVVALGEGEDGGDPGDIVRKAVRLMNEDDGYRSGIMDLPLTESVREFRRLANRLGPVQARRQAEVE